MSRTRRGVALALAATVAACVLATAGSLDPPAPPASTMKPIDTVEPRTPIFGSDLPLTINQPGSYYLAEDVDQSEVVGGGGITIAANVNDVTLDLMGYRLNGGAGDGIIVANPSKNVVIRNGIVSGWTARGIQFASCSGCVAADLILENNGTDGIRVSHDSIVRGVVARANGESGVQMTGRCSLLIDSVAAANNDAGVEVTNSGNLITGIEASGGAYGIDLLSVTADYNRIDANVVHGNGVGVRLVGGAEENVVIRNVASDNATDDYDIAVNNDPGPEGQAATATSPWANILP